MTLKGGLENEMYLNDFWFQLLSNDARKVGEKKGI